MSKIGFNILVINSDCLQVNSSANLCHLAYLRGLVDLGHKVTLLSADGRDYKLDEAMKIPMEIKCYTYYGVSLYEKASMRKKAEQASKNVISPMPVTTEGNSKGSLGSKIKEFILSLYGVHGIYATFVRKAVKFKSDEEFDYVISLSTPPSSHLLVHKLLKKKHIKAKQWIQIWEDPWWSDVYGFNGKKAIYREEKRLLKFAQKVCYVSPVTLMNQKRIYPESADKMFWQPLPYYYKNDVVEYSCEEKRYGYFGDYAPVARNLLPFYEAATELKVDVNICGNPSNLFSSTDTVKIHPRLSLNELKPLEDKTNVLIFLCNRKGGQIPGKIYQYSATNKVVLFILDGTEEEQRILKNYFAKFNRYVFCQNNKVDIMRAIKDIESNNFGEIENSPVEAFNPKETISKILRCENGD